MSLVPSYTLALAKINTWQKDIREARSVWGSALCTALPNHKFMRWLSKGGEGVLVLAWDANNQRESIVKFALPQMIVKDHDPFHYRRTKEPIWVRLTRFQKKVAGTTSHETEITWRFARGCENHEKLYRIMTDKGFFKYGFLPAVYNKGKSPKQFIEMQYINGKQLIEWCRERDNADVLAMFLKIIIFFELVFHGHGFIHSDPKPDNFLVVNDLPVILDPTISKDLGAAKRGSITNINTLLGSHLYASDEQLKHSRQRDYRDDIFTLLLTLWVMWARREPEGNIKINPQDPRDFERDLTTLFPSNIFPYSLRKVFEKGTLDRGRRYQDISALRTDIEGITAEHEEISGGIQVLKIIKRMEKIEKKLLKIGQIFKKE